MQLLVEQKSINEHKMNAPGLSLFQGAESIKLNSSLERQEEEDALEDQRRRNEEVVSFTINGFRFPLTFCIVA